VVQMFLLAGPGVLISTFALGAAVKVHRKYFLKSYHEGWNVGKDIVF
jgi:hypothetical protein